MSKKYAELTDEQKERILARNRAAKKRRQAERAIAEGRTPGVPGGVRRLTDEQRIENRKASVAKCRNKDLAASRAYDAEWKRKKRAARAIERGYAPLKPGQKFRNLELSDEEKLRRRQKRSRDYGRAHPEKIAGIGRARYLANRDEVLAKTVERHARVKAEDPERFKAWRATSDRNRRARSKNSSGKHKTADIKWLWDQQKGRCVFCLKLLEPKKFHVDHHIPLAKGGSNDRSNLRLLHKKCNLQKSARDPIEHAQEHGMLFW